MDRSLLAIEQAFLGDIYTSREVMDNLEVLCDEFGSRWGGTEGERPGGRLRLSVRQPVRGVRAGDRQYRQRPGGADPRDRGQFRDGRAAPPPGSPPRRPPPPRRDHRPEPADDLLERRRGAAGAL